MITIIVPVYNVEQYVSNCIESIIGQTYKELEIILVDDGSTDSSGHICDRYAQKDARIKVIHKQNGGLSDARNVGLDVATGEYIGFVDGDDFVSSTMYEKLLGIITSQEADLVICDYEEVRKNGYNPENQIEDDGHIQIVEGNDVFDLVTSLETKNIVAWNKLYKKEIFSDLRYESGRLHEDQWIIPYVVEKCSRIAYTDAKLYYYVFRDDAISKVKVSSKRMFDLLDALRNTCLFFKEKGLFSQQKLEARHICNYIINYYSMAESTFDNSYEIQLKLHSYFIKVMNECNNVFSWRQFVYKMFQINPRLGLGIKEIKDKLLHD
jgi:glycosyltransferase involved in cell wall biosynthesis